MRGPTIYLAGNIHGLPLEEARARWDRFRHYGAQMGFAFLSPLDGKEEEMRDEYDSREIVEADLLMVAAADIVVAYIDTPSMGTMAEMFYAWRVRRIPVVFVTANADLTRHHWIKALSQDILYLPETDWQTVAATVRDLWETMGPGQTDMRDRLMLPAT